MDQAGLEWTRRGSVDQAGFRRWVGRWSAVISSVEFCPPGGRLLVLKVVEGWLDARRGGTSVVVGWLVSRLLMLAILATVESIIVGDVNYYHRKIQAMFNVGLSETFYEYPTPVAWILWLPYGVSGGNRTGYLVAFIVFMLAIDTVFTWLLYRAAGRRRDRAVTFWIAYVFLIGPLAYVRFDLLTAVLAGASLLVARRHPAISGALVGLGAAIKLWPALLIAAIAGWRPDRKPALLWFGVVGCGLAALSLVLGGWTRLISPLTWQSGRGLQIESIWATPLMVARVFHSDPWVVDISKFQAFEIFGPGVSAFLGISNLATVLGMATIVALIVRTYRVGAPSATSIGLVILATVAVMTITNKTLSPQYLLWLAGPAAVLLLLTADPEHRLAVALRRLAVQLLVLAALTHLVYPLLYDGLRGLWGPLLSAVGVGITAARNIFLVIVTIEVCRLAWRSLTADQTVPGTDQHEAQAQI